MNDGVNESYADQGPNVDYPDARLKLRIAEIRADLAASKANFYAHGIVRPFQERLLLEAELAQLAVDRLKLQDDSRKRADRVRQLHNQMVKERLEAAGLGHIINECYVAAKAEIEKENANAVWSN